MANPLLPAPASFPATQALRELLLTKCENLHLFLLFPHFTFCFLLFCHLKYSKIFVQRNDMGSDQCGETGNVRAKLCE